MMKGIIIVTLFLAIYVQGRPQYENDPTLDDQWEDFKQRYGKKYKDSNETEYRRNVWEGHMKFIDKHNKETAAGQHTYTVGINEFADFTSQEFVKYFNGLKMNHTLQMNVAKIQKMRKDLPASVDWRKEGYVTPIKNQKQCGSCWAFSTTGSLEGQHFKKNKKLVSLSEQNLVDCDHVDHGCMGGLMENAYGYIKENKGIDTESSYPYTAKTGKKCLFKAEDVGATLQSYKSIPKGDEDALQKAVASVGPISVGIDAGHPSFQHYKKGIYYEPDCSSVRLDHGVLVVGYGPDYWLVKNSWGTSWGMEGYIKMSRNRKNNCGIATAAVYPE